MYRLTNTPFGVIILPPLPGQLPSLDQPLLFTGAGFRPFFGWYLGQFLPPVFTILARWFYPFAIKDSPLVFSIPLWADNLLLIFHQVEKYLLNLIGQPGRIVADSWNKLKVYSACMPFTSCELLHVYHPFVPNSTRVDFSFSPNASFPTLIAVSFGISPTLI